jgi:6-phosphogluconolactonase
VNAGSGALTPITGSPFSAGTGSPYALGVGNYMGVYSGYGDSLFVTRGDRVVGYYVNPPALTASDGYSATTGINPYSVTVDQLHSRLYVTNYGAASVSGYQIDDVGGTLTAVPGSPFPAGDSPASIAIL